MEIQNLRLQLLHIADGDVGKAQAMEKYVLEGTGLNQQMGEAVNGEKDEECNCFLCQLRKAIESNP